MLVDIAIVGVASAFSFAILKWKLGHGRKLDALCDLGIMIVLVAIFGGSYSGTAGAMIASALISIYLIFNPFKVSTKVCDWMKTVAKKLVIIIAVASVLVTLGYIGVSYVQ
jgi:hypothetical protein